MPQIKNDSGERVQVRFPGECPTCNVTMYPIAITFSRIGPNLDVFFMCTNQDCGRAFVGKYEDQFGNYVFKGVAEPSKKPPQLSPIIEKVSAQFAELYRQSDAAEQHNLLQICGAGYRKSLEFLIKDYCLATHPKEKHQSIIDSALGPCIDSYVENQKIKSVAKRAVWLGNDEVHYQRLWMDKDLQNLKELLQITMSWIEMEERTKHVLQEMPQKPIKDKSSGK